LSFQVTSPIFRGPIDLLLYLVRRHEVEITEILLAKVTGEFLEHVDVLKEISIDAVGDFVDVASRLVELKARALLPRNEFEEAESPEDTQDPREDLVHRLLLFRKFQDASSMLKEHAAGWRNRHSRVADDLPAKKMDISQQPIRDIELWDLVSAFGRILKNRIVVEDASIIYDDTPIHVYMEQIHARIVKQRSVSFSELFELGMHKSKMVSIFLAVLELARHHGAITQQDDLYGDLVVVPGDEFSETLSVSNFDDYNPHASHKEE